MGFLKRTLFSVGVGSGSNGGRSQTNLNYVQGGGEFPFMNLIKTAQNWSRNTGGSWPDASELDDDGYPLTGCASIVSFSGLNTVFYVPAPGTRRTDVYYFFWDGNGTLTVQSMTVLTGSLSTSGVKVQITAGLVGFSIVGVGTPRMTNLRFLHEDDVTAYNTGAVFDVKFLARLREAKFGVIRFLNWQDGNVTNAATWSSMKPVTYVQYAGNEIRPSIWCGTTSLAGSAYSAAAPAKDTATGGAWSNTLKQGTTVQLRFNSAIATTCTLQVGTSPAKNVLDFVGGTLASAGRYPVANQFSTLVYDVNFDAWLKTGDATRGQGGLYNVVPISVCVDLCTAVGAHPHFVMPPKAYFPITDFATQAATYCRDNAPAWMVPIFEGPNELWNTVFDQYYYAANVVTQLGWTLWDANYHEFYGAGLSLLGQAVAAVYGVAKANVATQTKYVITCGVQSSYGNSSGLTGSHNSRMTCYGWLASATPAPSGYVKEASSGWVNSMSTAQYFNPGRQYQAQELMDAYNFVVTNAGNSAAQTAILTAYVDSLGGAASVGPPNLAKLATWHSNWKTWAVGYGLKKMRGYEGGYSPDFDTFQGFSYITGATQANPCVLTLPDTSLTVGNSFDTANACVVGMKLTLASVPGMTQLNGVTGSTSPAGQVTVTAINVGSNPAQVAIDVNSTAFTAFDAGRTVTMAVGSPGVVTLTAHGLSYLSPVSFDTTGAFLTGVPAKRTLGLANPINASTFKVVDPVTFLDLNFSGTQSGVHTMVSAAGKVNYVNSFIYVNNLRQASKASSNLQNYTYGGAPSVYSNYMGLSDGTITAEFPSNYLVGGLITNTQTAISGGVKLDGLTGPDLSLMVWSVLQDIYTTADPPQWKAIKAFNA